MSSDALDKTRGAINQIANNLDRDITATAGRRLRFTLLIWDDVVWTDKPDAQDPKSWGVEYVHASTLPQKLIPDFMRFVADRFERKNAPNDRAPSSH